MDILSVVGALVHHHVEDETIYTSAGKYECCAPKWCYLTSLGTSQTITSKDIIGAYNLVPVNIWIKFNLVVIPHLHMDKVGCLVGRVSRIVARLEGSVLLIDIAGVTKNLWET